MLDHILEQINNTETLLLEYAGVNLHLDRQRMEETYFALLSDDTGSLDAFDQEDLKVLDHSVQQILDYAEVSDETAEKFASAVEAFLACVDKFARTPEATALRKELVKYFFEIYERACKKFSGCKSATCSEIIFAIWLCQRRTFDGGRTPHSFDTAGFERRRNYLPRLYNERVAA